MEITAVRIRLVGDEGSKVKAYADVTLDGCFVVRDVRLISGPSGLFVAMPYRELTFHCQVCSANNGRRATYCNNCGARLEAPPVELDNRERVKRFVDLAHPVTPECRAYFEEKIIEAYRQESARGGDRQPAGPAAADADAE